MRPRPFIIPFFLTHAGCPHRCVYCRQPASGARRTEPLTVATLRAGIEAGLASRRRKPDQPVEVAFYGGTFTALDRALQECWLETAGEFRGADLIQGLRLSTRPDALAEDQVAFLAARGTTTVEIGAQSLDDAVLKAAGRGHTAAQTRKAAERVRAAGLRLGLQMLPGLPSEDQASRDRSLEEILALAPDEVRLYPLLVLRGTVLAEMHDRGGYQPLGLDEAVDVCARMYRILTAAGIVVTRLGLQDSPELKENVLAGPYHPAFGHMVKSRVAVETLARVLAVLVRDRRPPAPTETVLRVALADLPLALGLGGSGLEYLRTLSGLAGLTVLGEPNLPRGQARWRGHEFTWDGTNVH